MSDLGNELNQQILELCQQGQKLAAIKLLKEQTGLELKECKDYVEKLAAANGIVPKSGCFVATACYGSYDAPEVVVLRHYRDNTLLQTDLGRLFVKFYYRVSPYIAAKIATSDSAKKCDTEVYIVANCTENSPKRVVPNCWIDTALISQRFSKDATWPKAN